MLRRTLTMLAVACTTACQATPTEWRNIIPEPRSITVTGEQVEIVGTAGPAATLVVGDRNRQTEIAAAEINQRLYSLGLAMLPIRLTTAADGLKDITGLPIVLTTCDASDLARSLVAASGARIAPADPGVQGYIIQFPRLAGRTIALLCGSDALGTLYAAVSLRHFIEKDAGRGLLTVGEVRDWPDFKFRGTGSLQQMRKALPVYGSKGEAYVTCLKAQIDWMLRCKLNMLGDYFYGSETVPPVASAAEWMRPLNDYAHERGFLCEEYQSTNVGTTARHKDDPRFAGMQLINGMYFTWSDDELLRKRAREMALFYQAAGLDCVVLHPQDGGGVPDPELWSKRSEADKARWGDDRAAADAHVFSIFYEEFRKLNPRQTIVYVVYPYSAIYFDWDGIRRHYPDVSFEQFRKTGPEYHKRIGSLIPEDVAICVWLGERKYMDEFRACYGKRPMYYWYKMASGWVDSGWIITASRFMGTNCYNHPADIMATRIDRNFPNYITRAVAGQFAWNTASEGAESFTGKYYDFRTDNGDPATPVIDRWGLLACRNMWGATAGTLIFEAFNKRIIPSLIVQPGRVVDDPNRFLRRQKLPPIEVSPEMLLQQAQACQTAAAALDKAIAMQATCEDLSARLFTYYLQRTHCLAAYAQAHYHLMMANQGVTEGDGAKVEQHVTAGETAIEVGLADLQRLQQETATLKQLDATFYRQAAKGVYPAVPGVDADFPKLRDSLVAARRRMADRKLQVTRIKHEGPVRVAIYSPAGDGGSAIGEKSWALTLEGLAGYQVTLTDDLSLSNLLKHEVLLYPQCTTGRSAGRYEFLEVLKRFVEEGGGGVLFSHNSVGFERSQFGSEVTFPQIGQGATARLDSSRVVVAAEHAITSGLKLGEEGTHSYYDHLVVKPGSKGTVILRDPAGGAVLVAGQQKRGRVIYDGTILLTPDTKRVGALGVEGLVFLNALQWLAARTK